MQPVGSGLLSVPVAGLAPGLISCEFRKLLRSIAGPVRVHGLSNVVSRDVLYNVAEDPSACIRIRTSKQPPPANETAPMQGN